ncbi:MAG TPA: M23 family metallopeptidase, partial [Nitrospirae bacterium]|nr:M23 family metallopeptidase [Nitrospirota bacterium]
MNIMMNIIRIAIIAFLFLSSNTYAFDIKVAPKDVIPGDVFSIKVKDIGSATGEAEFNGNKIDLQTAGDDLIALVPVPLDTESGKYSITVRYGKEEQIASVEVKAHKFKTIQLTLPEGKVILSPKNLERAQREAKLQSDVWFLSTVMAWEGNFVSPTGTPVSTEFGLNRIINKKRNSVHRGTDFRGKKGAPVRSINSGRVVLAANLFFGGNTLVIDHGMGLYSIYMHLSKFNVSKGDKVSKEQTVGFVGSTGRATGPHLHMSVKLKG